MILDCRLASVLLEMDQMVCMFNTCKRHFILSPGAMMTVVKTPLSMPALNSCMADSCSSGVFCCRRLPIPNPRKHTANIGVTPIKGAAIPEKASGSVYLASDLIIIIYHDFLPTPRRGSHVKSGKTHTQCVFYQDPPLSPYT